MNPFKCGTCGKNFARRQHLERHQAEAHLRLFFDSKLEIHRSKNDQTRTFTAVDDPRKYKKCDICDQLISKRQFADHKRSHSGIFCCCFYATDIDNGLGAESYFVLLSLSSDCRDSSKEEEKFDEESG